MKKYAFELIVALVLAVGLPSNAPAQDREKLAQTGLQFLSVISDARAAALAGTMTGLESNSSALFFNPAAMGFTSSFVDATFSLNEWIADINHSTVSLSLRPAGGEYGVFGLSVQTVDYGEILGTIVDPDPNSKLGYIDTGNLSASAFAIGLGYGRMLSDRFGVGGQIKWVRQDLGNNLIPVTDSTTTKADNEVKVLAFDFGTLYKTGLKSLAFGFSVRNFSEEIEYAQESFQLPLVFSLGASMNLVDLTSFNSKDHAVLLSIQATNERSHAEQVSFGLEYKFLSVLSLRGGFVTKNDEEDVAFGFGLSRFGLQVDYAYTPFGIFDEVQRVTARFSK
ncbi:PorV/PorQ family protein [candidate division KSB1 bacterium]|nr:PorV/PorQ family protein [candidate division KSB1 bacterium]